MKKPILVCLALGLALCAAAQKLSRQYQNVSMSEALQDLNQLTTAYHINFMYNDLEHFRVTTDIRQKSVPEAIRQVIGFYPVRMTWSGKKDIFVECIHKADRHLTGTIVDEKGRPMAYANIAVLNPVDSTLLSGGVSNESGYFAIPYSQPSVLVRISYVGCKTVWRLCHSGQMGTVRMQEAGTLLHGISVYGQTPVLRREAGKIVFDTRHIVGAINATDLLRYAPGMAVEDDHLSLFGAGGVIFCINGKEQRMGQKEMLQMLRSYPASDVDRIEIIQSPGARYAAEGNAGVVNIILKKKANDYVGGTLGYAHTQYEEHGDEATANLIYNKGKVQTSLNVAGTWNNTRYRETNDIWLGDLFRSNIDNGHVGKDNYSARWQIDYKASDRLSLGAYAMVSDGNRRLNVDNEYSFDAKETVGDSYIVTTETHRREDTRTYALNVNASQQLNEQGAKIDYNLDYYRMKMGDDRTALGMHSLTGTVSGEFHSDEFRYQNEITQTVDNYSAKVDATISNFRLGSQYVFTRSRRQLFHSWASVPWAQSDFRYDEQVLAAYAEYSHRLGDRLSIDLGARYEQTWTEGRRQADYDIESHHNSYGRLFPSVHIGWQPSENHSLNLSLSSRITRPNVINVNPDTLYSDTYHTTMGNPHLKPTYLYKAMTGYTYKGVLSFDLYYAWQPKGMSSVAYLTNNRTRMTTWDNAVDHQDLGINSFYYFDRLSWMTAILMQGIGWSQTKGDGQHTLSATEGWSYTGMLQTSFFFDSKRRWTANLNLTYSSPEKDVTKRLDSRYMVDAGLQYRFWHDRLTLGITCRNLLASHITGTEYLGQTTMDFNNKFNYRQLRLTLTYNWGARLRQSRRLYNSDEMKERVVNDF